jgi:hypothetical protein
MALKDKIYVLSVTQYTAAMIGLQSGQRRGEFLHTVGTQMG